MLFTLLGDYVEYEGNQHRVDEHDNIVAAHNVVPGAGHTIAHDCNQTAFGDMAKVASIQLQYEAKNVFCGRIQEFYIHIRYCGHVLTATPHENSAHKDAVAADIL
eukprot:7798192-Ditylum_brightwellii.AAC.1